jgi:hypothetical protein
MLVLEFVEQMPALSGASAAAGIGSPGESDPTYNARAPRKDDKPATGAVTN